MATIADLIMRQGEIAARGAERSGEIWGNAVSQLGQIGAGAFQQYTAQKEEKKRMAMFDEAMSSFDPANPGDFYRKAAVAIGPEAATSAVRAFAALEETKRRNAPDPKLFAEQARFLKQMRQTNPGWVTTHWSEIAGAIGPQAEALYGVKVGPEYSEEYGQMLDAFNPDEEIAKPVVVGGRLVQPTPAGAKVLYEPPPEAPKPPETRVVGNTLVDTSGKVIYRAPEGAGAAEPLVPIIGPDGQPVLVRRGDAVGKRPASNREQGRPVVSGDANRIADLDTSLNDLETLSGTLTGSKATGTQAKIGASVPNWVTEATGIGTEAKQKQAVIDRVKQVIGKALEGGVLRKEDEYKYEKILPVISDVKGVVEAKLKGLETAIRQRRQTTLDALSDAGYDTTRFERRESQKPAKPAPALAKGEDALLKKYGY